MRPTLFAPQNEAVLVRRGAFCKEHLASEIVLADVSPMCRVTSNAARAARPGFLSRSMPYALVHSLLGCVDGVSPRPNKGASLDRRTRLGRPHCEYVKCRPRFVSLLPYKRIDAEKTYTRRALPLSAVNCGPRRCVSAAWRHCANRKGFTGK